MEWQPIETAPKDRQILMFAFWSWDGVHGFDPEPEWRVVQWDAEFSDDGWWMITNNPYSDKAVDPQAWAELPPAAPPPPKETQMTKDELIERVAEIIADHCCADSVEEWERDTARAVVDLLMPPPLVWKVVSVVCSGPDGQLMSKPAMRAFDSSDDCYFYRQDHHGRMALFTPDEGLDGVEIDTFEAAQAAAQAHADAAWIAQTRAAQEDADG